MPIELRSWINPQSYSNSYSTAPIAREAAYFTPVPEPVTADPDYISSAAQEYEAAGYDSSIVPQSAVATLYRVSDGRAGVHLILGSRLEIFTGVLTRDAPFDFDGEFYRVCGAFSGVKPVQSPRPVISMPAESPEAIEIAARFADVLAFHGISRAKAAGVNLNMLVGETDEQARQHLHDLEQSIRRLQEFRAGERAAVRSIREDRFADLGVAGNAA